MVSHLTIDDKGWLRRDERKKVLEDAHHPRRWPSLSQGACCANRLKAESKKPGGLLHPLDVPLWKWKSIPMDFIDGLPRSRKENTSMWVIVGRLTKSAHFTPVKSERTAL